MTHKSVEEFSVKTLDVCGFQPAEAAVRLPFGNKNAPGDSAPFEVATCETGWSYWMYAANLDLMSKLVKRGDEHAKVLRGVMVWCEINAPRYFYQELDRYRIGCECLSSESTMHMQGKGLNEDELVMMKERLLEGTMQKRIWVFSYQTLRRIYFQRRTHRLPQWRIFCEWIERLPFAKQLITIDGRDNKD